MIILGLVAWIGKGINPVTHGNLNGFPLLTVAMVSTEENLLSFEQYLHYDDGTDNRYELVAGKLELMNSPTVLHWLISKCLERVFEQEIQKQNLSLIGLQGIGIRTGLRKSRIPDFVIVQQSAIQPLHQAAVLEVPPALVIEIVSPESIKRDYRYKRSEYAALEILEYWIIDPINYQVTVLIWQEGLYEETIFTQQETIISQQFPDLQVTVEQVLNQQI